MNQPQEFAALFALPFEQRLQLAEDLWDSIADEAQARPVPESQVAELRRRGANFDAGDNATLTWDEVKRSRLEG